jgi:hypothetical protein
MIIKVNNNQVTFRCSHVKVETPITQIENIAIHNLDKSFYCKNICWKTIIRMNKNNNNPINPNSAKTDMNVLWAWVPKTSGERNTPLPIPIRGD